MASRAPPSPPPPPLRRLRRLLGPDGVIARDDRLLAYASDALTTIEGHPACVLLPRTREELREAVRLLHRADAPFVPRGAGTGLAGGAVARGATLVCTARLDRILELDPEGRRIRVEPGVTTARVDAAARRHGLRYLPDPASAEACTVGGNVATNAGGPHCLRHGVTSDHVLSLEVVLPDGTAAELGRGEDGGLDLAGLFVGSEGTLGVVAAVTLRLVPAPPAVRTALGLFDRLEDGGRAVADVLAAGVLPVALEMVDRGTLEIVEASPFASGLPTDVAAALILEVEGFEAEVEEELRQATEVMRAAAAREVRTADDPEERARLWRARKKAYGALGRRAPEVLLQDAVVPRGAIAELLPRLEGVAERHGVPLVNYFHAGDGNLHPHLLFDRRDPDQVRRVERAGEEMMALCVEAGGTITGEHGVGLDKVKAMRLIFSETELEAQRAVRRALDPAGLCNADKVLPPAEEA